MRRRGIILFLGLLLVMGSVNVSHPLESEPMIPYIEQVDVVIDGTIGPEEYMESYRDSVTDMVIYWVHDGTDLYVGIDSPGTGWIGIAFGPKGQGMDGINMIVGYVDNTGELFLIDEVGVGWMHQEDTTLGGTDDILAKAGSESNGRTYVEFIVPLNSGDKLDHHFELDTMYGFFVAYQASTDDFASYHTARSSLLDVFVSSSYTPTPDPDTKMNSILSLNVPTSVLIDESVVLKASLEDETGTPIEGAIVCFDRITAFGVLELGIATTNSEGDAEFEYEPRTVGPLDIQARYDGTENRASAKSGGLIRVDPLISGDDDAWLAVLGFSAGITMNEALSWLGVGVIALIVGSIVLTFGYVGYQVIFVYREREIPDKIEEPLRFEWRR